jgi:hypothetical protein
MFNFRAKKVDDYASVPKDIEIKGIKIPEIPLEKYPEISERIAGLVEKIAVALSEKDGRPLEEILENLEVTDFLKYIPLLIKVAAEEFFSFAAFILDVEDVDRIKKLNLYDLTKIINAVYTINKFAEVQDEIQNFMKALTVKSQGKK